MITPSYRAQVDLLLQVMPHVAREECFALIHTGLTDADRHFLLSFKSGEPEWSLFPQERLECLPAVQWKLSNIQTLKSRNPEKHAEQVKALEKRLV